MLFPDEYKYVGVTNIHPDDVEDDTIYFLSEYMVVERPLDKGIEYSIFYVEKEGTGFLQRVRSLQCISSGSEVIKYGEQLNIKDRALLIETADRLCIDGVNTVIFTGIDHHMTFVHEPDLSNILEIEIVDVAPPHPSWLSHVIRRLETSGIFGEFSVRFRENITDLSQFEGDRTVFPCSCSGLDGKCLDSDVITEPGSLVVGCEISKSLFESRFPELEYDLVNICPLHSDIVRPTAPFITRCCRTERSGPIDLNGIKGAVVHWGASEFDVAEAIRDLVFRMRKKDSGDIS
ncbi:MAG: hypothetical protein K8R64_02480 [Methanosarcinaceae archaeon]|nr:hypothetical protein [Methanosarcinaceae archaeon]